ncbi:MAG: hypothetical protein KF901_33615 [Myxococcales bacterium]|nr:hypothetical protein [Myxococcales bacterium]
MTRDSDDVVAQRAAARASWAGRVCTLEEEGEIDLSHSTTASERLGMMWRLALDAWASAGEPIPDYTRAETPGRMIRRRG